ncbi:hypothetical protein GCM10023222_16050 [Saccharopolyspora cebuensis]
MARPRRRARRAAARPPPHRPAGSRVVSRFGNVLVLLGIAGGLVYLAADALGRALDDPAPPRSELDEDQVEALRAALAER